jgi:hypothetical protein
MIQRPAFSVHPWVVCDLLTIIKSMVMQYDTPNNANTYVMYATVCWRA